MIRLKLEAGMTLANHPQLQALKQQGWRVTSALMEQIVDSPKYVLVRLERDVPPPAPPS